MAILSHEQTNAIRTIRREIEELHSDWDCEGADDRQNIFYNNEIEACFFANYNGNITMTNGIEEAEIPENVKEQARLEGMIRRIVDGENIEGVLSELSNDGIDRE